MSARIRIVLGVLALVVVCRRAAPPPLVLDLADAAAAADLESRWTFVRFGTTSAEPSYEKGFAEGRRPPGADPSAGAKLKPQLMVRFDEPADRTALLDLAPHPGVAAQSADVFLNNTPIGHLLFERARRRYPLLLPAAAQKRGINRLRLEFAATAQGDDGTPLAAQLFGLWVAPRGEAALEALAARTAPPPLSIAVEGGQPRLH